MTWREHSDAARGWLNPDERDALWSHAASVGHLGPLLEIGTYCGKSAIALGDAARRNETVLFCVDWHRGSPEMAPGRECHHPEMMDGDVFDSLPHWRRNIRNADLEEYVVAVVGNSSIVGLWWQIPVSFMFIDGAHDALGVRRDYELWARHVLPGGMLAFHDSNIGDIGRVADRAAEEGFTVVEFVDTLRVLRAS